MLRTCEVLVRHGAMVKWVGVVKVGGSLWHSLYRGIEVCPSHSVEREWMTRLDLAWTGSHVYCTRPVYARGSDRSDLHMLL